MEGSSIIVPVLNESATIREVIQGTIKPWRSLVPL